VKQKLTAEIAAPRSDVWAALARDIGNRGEHVVVLEERAPEIVRLRVRVSAGEHHTLGYRLAELGVSHTAVTASIEPAGPVYFARRLLSFTAVERGYLDAIAAGLANLQQHFEAPPEEPGPNALERDT